MADTNEEKRPVVPEPGQDAGKRDAPSPDPRDKGQADETPLTPEPGTDTPGGAPAPPPPSEGGPADTIHLEDDRIRTR